MSEMSRELLFSVTEKDCEFEYSRGSGPGGQKRNKTSSSVRCVHKESGAVGQSDKTRSQHENKRIAFRLMAESKIFQSWIRLEIAKRTGVLKSVEDAVERDMKPKNLVVEGKNENGLWTNIAV